MGKAVRASEPSWRSSRFIVGQDARGLWVVFDRLDIVGGLFADRASAVHFALAEANYDAKDVYCAPGNELLNFFAALSQPSPSRRISAAPARSP
jgi:hypothetical protein